MRTRKLFKSVAEIKKNPDIRIVFAKPFWADFIATQKLADDLEANVGQVARQIVVNLARRYAKADKAGKEAMALDIIQGLHGVVQLQLFDKKKIKPRPAAHLRKVKNKKNRKAVKKL